MIDVRLECVSAFLLVQRAEKGGEDGRRWSHGNALLLLLYKRPPPRLLFPQPVSEGGVGLCTVLSVYIVSLTVYKTPRGTAVVSFLT